MTHESAPPVGQSGHDDAQVGRGVRAARDPRKAARRRILIGGFLGVLVLVGLLWWIWTAFLAPKHEETDNAYTNVEVAEVTPLVSGPVKAVYVVDTQLVRAGQVLFVLDDTDQRQAVDLAAATLESARRQVRQEIANDVDLARETSMRQADVAVTQAGLVQADANLAKARLDVRRRQLLAGPGAVSAEELSDSLTLQSDAKAAVGQAEARLTAAQAAAAAAAAARGANRVLFDNTTVETNPLVQAAKARLDTAQTDLDRTVIRAPISGVVDQRKLAVGQMVRPGVPVMVVVPISRIYVDANFKEGQLRDVRAGQPARVVSDLYGGRVVYHGRVQGFAGGSGSAFAAIPAQNATGNWIKVVQRLPTRISLDPDELQRHPLRVGLSMTVDVDTSAR